MRPMTMATSAIIRNHRDRRPAQVLASKSSMSPGVALIVSNWSIGQMAPHLHVWVLNFWLYSPLRRLRNVHIAIARFGRWPGGKIARLIEMEACWSLAWRNSNQYGRNFIDLEPKTLSSIIASCHHSRARKCTCTWTTFNGILLPSRCVPKIPIFYLYSDYLHSDICAIFAIVAVIVKYTNFDFFSFHSRLFFYSRATEWWPNKTTSITNRQLHIHSAS